MTHELQLVVVEDDEWKRSAMAQRLDEIAEIEVVRAVGQDEAVSWDKQQWSGVEAVLIDVYDEQAPGEVGTDLYSGISVIERLHRLKVRSVAITPSCAHPVVQLRLYQAHPGWVYHRWQVADLDALASAVLFPDRTARLDPPDPGDLKGLGVQKLLANDAVAAYVRSPLYGTLVHGIGLKGLKALGVSRRQVDTLKHQIEDYGFDAVDENAGTSPRWPEIRDLLLMLLGRLDAPPTEYDKPWWHDA